MSRADWRVLLSWHIADELMPKLTAKGFRGKFIIPLPEPRVIGLEFAPTGSQRVQLGQHAETAVEFAVKPKLGALLHLFATLLGEVPADSRLWIVTDDVP